MPPLFDDPGEQSADFEGNARAHDEEEEEEEYGEEEEDI